MTVIISIFIIVAIASMMLFLLVRNLRNKSMVGIRHHMTVALLCLTLVSSIAELLTGGNSCMRMSVDILPLMLALIFIASPIWEPKLTRIVCIYTISVQLSILSLQILDLSGVIGIMADQISRIVLYLNMPVSALMLMAGIWQRMRDVRSVIKGGTVLINLGLSVDIVYIVMLMSVEWLLTLSLAYSGTVMLALDMLAAVIAAGAIAALCIRITCDSLFVLMHDQEIRIFESMKVSQVEIANAKKDDAYRELYERVVEYFERDEPFLNSKLTINNVARAVFSNKLYISRAISQYTGRNFCQFVNYYRISYSLECFRNNPDLRVAEMAQMSGFNSAVSYNSAFRLFIDEIPSDWCRKERQKIRRKKK